MTIKMNRVLEALIGNYGQGAEALLPALQTLFDSDKAFLEKVEEFDQIFSTHPAAGAIQEYAFDLLMSHHLYRHQEQEDYFDTKEWLDIEDKTLERGTELLNMMLYISEAKDNEVEMELEDFLYEFLLVDEDEFQDEHKIYEGLISNRELIEENEADIIDACSRMEVDEELKDLVLPVFLFFKDPQAVPAADTLTRLQPLQRALYATLLAAAA